MLSQRAGRVSFVTDAQDFSITKAYSTGKRNSSGPGPRVVCEGCSSPHLHHSQPSCPKRRSYTGEITHEGHSQRYSPYERDLMGSLQNALSHPCAVLCLVTQSCLTLCHPVDCSLPASSVHGNLQARILEWVAVPSSMLLRISLNKND